MKKYFIALLFLGFILNGSAQSNCLPLFPKVKLSSLDSLINGNWYYQYSFNSDSTFNVFTSQHLNYNMPERIMFYKSSKKDLKRTSAVKSLSEFRNASCLSQLEYFEDYKGIASYPKLRSNLTDPQGYLINCYIDLWLKIEDKPAIDIEPDLNIYSLTNKIMVLKKKSPDEKKWEFHVYVK